MYYSSSCRGKKKDKKNTGQLIVRMVTNGHSARVHEARVMSLPRGTMEDVKEKFVSVIRMPCPRPAGIAWCFFALRSLWHWFIITAPGVKQHPRSVDKDKRLDLDVPGTTTYPRFMNTSPHRSPREVKVHAELHACWRLSSVAQGLHTSDGHVITNTVMSCILSSSAFCKHAHIWQEFAASTRGSS